MSFRYVEQGIAAIQAGNLDEGARLLRIALRDETLTGGIRAVACLWLAETTNDPKAKRTYYDQAIAADPNNSEIRLRLERWLASQLSMPPLPPAQTAATNPPAAPKPAAPPTNPPAAPTGYAAPTPAVVPATYTPPMQPTASPAAVPPTIPGLPNVPASPTAGGSMFPSGGAPMTYSPARSTAAFNPMVPTAAASGQYHVVGIIGGPNGPGTAFFVSQDGLLATTRYVVGGQESVTVELETGFQIPGRVLRSYPELDLAIVYVQQPVNDLMPITPLPRIPEETPLMAFAYNGQVARGNLRTTRRILSPQWFPTTIERPVDAGGDPVFDDNRTLVGMLTRNASPASPNLYGIHINAIRKTVETFKQEMTDGKKLYCPACGNLSKAATSGGYYCEACGSLMAHATHMMRGWRDASNITYREQNRIACRHCSATVGFHKGFCLRCGREQK